MCSPLPRSNGTLSFNGTVDDLDDTYLFIRGYYFYPSLPSKEPCILGMADYIFINNYKYKLDYIMCNPPIIEGTIINNQKVLLNIAQIFFTGVQ